MKERTGKPEPNRFSQEETGIIAFWQHTPEHLMETVAKFFRGFFGIGSSSNSLRNGRCIEPQAPKPKERFARCQVKIPYTTISIIVVGSSLKTFGKNTGNIQKKMVLVAAGRCIKHKNPQAGLQAGLQNLPLESVDFSGSKSKLDGLQQFNQEAGPAQGSDVPLATRKPSWGFELGFLLGFGECKYGFLEQ